MKNVPILPEGGSVSPGGPACEAAPNVAGGQAVVSDAKVQEARPHLAYLDGIRGLSALYVVLYHGAYGRDDLPFHLSRWLVWLNYGRFAVDVFIVLSGYCLMLPVARAMDMQLRGGVGAYLQRMAWRILPPYFMTIVLSIAIVWLGRQFRHGHFVAGAVDPEALSVGNIVAHLLLVHNLSTRYVASLNPVLWTVALEWQLYFVFPFVLLPLWRRLGVTALVIVGSLLGLAFLLLPSAYNLAWSCPWFIGLFAMGMAGAVLSESRMASHRAVFLRTPWLPAVAGLCAVLLPRGWFGTQRYWVEDIMIGLATACLILHCARALRAGTGARRDPLLRLFQSRAAVTLGMFSYSLYLVHMPFGWMFLPLTRALHLSGAALFAFSLGIKIPLVCALAYGFYLVCERPFTSAGARKPARTSA